ncbi:MAG: hypothetical protein PVS2B3_06400 [Steroidobacteraceae bacterium]
MGYPSKGALAGVWFDTAAPAPANATATQLAQEAINAAAHFGNATAAANRYAQYVVVSRRMRLDQLRAGGRGERGHGQRCVRHAEHLVERHQPVRNLARHDPLAAGH